MDGTLTLPIHDFDVIRTEIGVEEGLPILEAIDKMSPDRAIETKQKLHNIENDLAKQAIPQPGAISLLDRLKNKGCQLGILTRNDDHVARITLEAARLSEFFEERVVVGRETCVPKPDPAGVLHLLKIWSAAPDSTLLVGDYLHDLKAGFDAGITTVHVDSSEIYPWPEYTHHRVASINQLLSMI